MKSALAASATGLLLLSGLSACSSTPSLSKVDSYVVEACGITQGTEGDTKGEWIAPPMEDGEDSKPWSAWDDPIARLVEIRDDWQVRVIPATSAAQTDERFRPLADAIKGMLDTITLVVELREARKPLNPAYEGLNLYNSQLITWRTECNATANRLPN